MLYRVTGDQRYRRAFLHDWRSILRFDRRNTGGFSSGERATGNAYEPSAIETCCSIAWTALGIDALRLAGDPLAADELELSLLNAVAGAQHPSGRWWTYNTPMDGFRQASAHTIVFQARAGTPELNCCSVNGPRGLSFLCDWAVMADGESITVNSYLPGRFTGRLADGTPLALRWETDYPLEGRVRLCVEPGQPKRFALRLRIPAWSHSTRVSVNANAADEPRPGRYVELSRVWQRGDTVQIDFDMRLRFVVGDRQAADRVSIYRGPILLAYDQRYNAFDEDQTPAVDLARLDGAKLVAPPASTTARARVLSPWLTVDLPCADGRRLRLCDFASAGAAGTRYVSWLAARACPPPPVCCCQPADGATLSPGDTVFRWRRPSASVDRYELECSLTPDFTAIVFTLPDLHADRVLMGDCLKRRLPEGQSVYWRLLATNRHGTTPSAGPASQFRLDRSLAPASEPLAPRRGTTGELLEAALHGRPEAGCGELDSATGYSPAAGPDAKPGHALTLAGWGAMLVYGLDEFPAEDYSASVWVNVAKTPSGLGQVFSAWARTVDDPLRICFDRGKLYARIEAGRIYSTPGVECQPNRWHHLAAVKGGTRLTLYVDGHSAGSVQVPRRVESTARNCALGGNPNLPAAKAFRPPLPASRSFPARWARRKSPSWLANRNRPAITSGIDRSQPRPPVSTAARPADRVPSARARGAVVVPGESNTRIEYMASGCKSCSLSGICSAVLAGRRKA